MRKIIRVLCIFGLTLFLIAAKPALAAHPLVTDDTGTQGKGKYQIELNGEYEHDKEDGVKSDATNIAGAFTMGLTDTIDLVLGVPFQFTREVEDTDDGHETNDEEGFSDVSLEAKWRFFEREGLSFAVKPGVTFPTGDRDKGLSGGRMTYTLYLISTLEAGKACFHVNAGYIRNENKDDDRRDLWHASMAMEYAVLEKVKLVADIGVDRNDDKGCNTNPAFILGGIIYSLTDSLDLDAGIKGGLNDVAPDYSLLAGLTWKF